jgi:1-acyl-sn-glycerol-3-phosphate acyltransferase
MPKTSLLTQTNLFIRSLLFSIFMILAATFYSFVSLLLWPLPLRYRYASITGWTATVLWVLKKLCYVDYKITGLENIPSDRNGVILSKHQSTWETFFLPTIFHQTAIILKRELLWVPFFGWGLATIAPIAINRSKTGNAMEQIVAQGKKCLALGRWILVFPEGTRIPFGKVGHYRLGGARLATAAGCPVIPVAHNAGYYWAKRKFIKRPGTIEIVIGELIETKDRTPDEVMKEVRDWIEMTIKEIG